MGEYVVWQKAEVWYKTDVSADTPEQAIKLAEQDGKGTTGWEIDLDTSVMIDEFEVYDENGSLIELDKPDGLV
jgi:hypothetical protein